MRKPNENKQNMLSAEDRDQLANMCASIVDRGFVARHQLEEEYGPGFTSQAIAILFRTHRLLREVTRKDNNGEQVLGYEWADQRFSQSQIRKLEECGLGFVLQFQKDKRQRYKDFELVTMKCKWTSPPLGAMPQSDEKIEKLVFDRDEEGSVYVPAYCLRAMTLTALPLIGKESAIGFKIQFASVRIPNPDIKMTTRPVVDGNKGLGLKNHEYLSAGTEFTIEAMVPTSALTREEFARAIAVAGKFVRFSPGRSHGFGEFRVIS